MRSVFCPRRVCGLRTATQPTRLHWLVTQAASCKGWHRSRGITWSTCQLGLAWQRSVVTGGQLIFWAWPVRQVGAERLVHGECQTIWARLWIAMSTVELAMMIGCWSIVLRRFYAETVIIGEISYWTLPFRCWKAEPTGAENIKCLALWTE